MTGQPVYQITTAPPPPRPARPRHGIRRGLAAVAVLFLTAADDLVCAATGWPHAARIWRDLAAAIRTAYRHGATASPAPAAPAPITPASQSERENANGHTRR
jgi:hypothetical protein